jgi:hypothetical protein
MPLRFRRSLRLLPGVKLNIGKQSASLSVGGRGATLNFSKRGVTQTLGIPGTGISYQQRLGAAGGPSRTSRPSVFVVGLIIAAVVWALLKAL